MAAVCCLPLATPLLRQAPAGAYVCPLALVCLRARALLTCTQATCRAKALVATRL